ncbi:MAG TPA: hypothetical protein VNH22_01620 [Blastocatellia bacterium]|jgi:hypothetical protein|nr:hypothetical protein [Blastocatellia bacterium]
MMKPRGHHSSPVPKKNNFAQVFEQSMCEYCLTAHFSHTILKHTGHFKSLRISET